jgi:hypothetical protein
MAREGVAPCDVVVDEQLPPSGVEMSKTIFKRAKLRVGDPVVVSGRTDRIRVVGRLGDRLDSCQIAVSPKLAIFLGIMQGDEVNVRGPITIDGKGAVDTEDFDQVLQMPQDRLEPLMGEDLRYFSGLTVEQVLDHLERHGNEFSSRYLVAGPNPEGLGIPVGEACEDPSLDEKVWNPEEK